MGVGNNITSVGRSAFLRSIFSVPSLNACAGSNNSCSVCGLEPGISDVNRFASSRQNRICKLSTILAVSSSDSLLNMNLLQNVPTSLIPMVLKLSSNIHFGTTPQTHLHTNLYLELTSGTRTFDHDAWDNIEEKTRSINCVYELVKGLVVPLVLYKSATSRSLVSACHCRSFRNG